jgi:hypothetical protein
MRQGDAQIFQRRVAVPRIGWTWRQRQRCTPSRDRAQHGVDESAGASFSRPLRQVDGIVHNRGRRDAGEVKQLIAAEAKDLDDFRIEAIDRALGKLDDQVIQGGPPALDAAGDLGGERPIAVVVKTGAG